GPCYGRRTMVDTAKPDTTDPKVAKPKAGLGALPAPDEKLFPLYAVAYTESVRGVTQQAGVLDGARTRAGVLITAANVVTALLATPAIRDRPGGAGLGPGGWLAIAAFVVSMASALYILWPWTGWRF